MTRRELGKLAGSAALRPAAARAGAIAQPDERRFVHFRLASRAVSLAIRNTIKE